MAENRKKILIVDDDETFSQMVKMNLEEIGGFEVRVENNSLQALSSARAMQPDLILLDMMMPDMDGGEVARMLLMDPRLRRIPVIFLTGIVQEEELASSGGMMGGRHFIAKPVSTQKLIDDINRVLDRV
ncbi:MAG: response regulator [Candidatus Omnitrophica bacterium]|nr:response regulator [Candidatus Omnitrophota bacterium]MDD5488234.1 response regulator [Candidatus Omnitrophota bacterium]